MRSPVAVWFASVLFGSLDASVVQASSSAQLLELAVDVVESVSG
ncbi:hypothetical protein [Nannocystis pusilla]|nr:hypothetical protein [Nannocystis pusilla]